MVIRDALVELLETKHLDEITVKELCEKADINRATFYRNYLDIYDLFEKLEEELTRKAFGDTGMEEGRYRLLDLIYENQVFYREFFRAGLTSSYVQKELEEMSEQTKEILKKRGTYDPKTFAVSYRYNCCGAVGVIKDWVMRGCPEKPEDLGEILYGIVDKQYR